MARVVIVAPEDLPVPPSRGGSVQIYLYGLIRALRNHDSHHVTLISPGKSNSASLPLIHVHGRKSIYQQVTLKRLRTLTPEIVQIDNRPDFLLKVKQALPRTKLILNLHSNTFLSQRNIAYPQARRALRAADAVILNSQYLKGWIEHHFSLSAGAWNPFVIYPGIDIEKFRRPYATARNVLVTPNRPLHILLVGRVIRQKGVHILVSATKDLQQRYRVPVHVTIVGRTPPWERNYGRMIRTKIKRLPIRWVGFVHPDRLPQYYWTADVLICPSQWREAFGLVNVEAMAAGLPVVASRVGGIREVVDETSGILIKDYRNPQAFAKALRTLAGDLAYRERLQAGAKKRAEQFGWDRAARHFSDLYTQL